MPNILRTLSTFPQCNVTETQVISGATHTPSLIQRETWSSNRAGVFTTRCGNSLSCRYLPCTNPQMDTCQHHKTPIFHIQPAVSIILHDTTCIKPSQFVYTLPRFPAYLERLSYPLPFLFDLPKTRLSPRSCPTLIYTPLNHTIPFPGPADFLRIIVCSATYFPQTFTAY